MPGTAERKRRLQLHSMNWNRPLPPPATDPSPDTPHTLSPTQKARLRNRECRHLYSGSRFQGTQKSGRCSYNVTVQIQHVDLDTSFLCGYLHIEGLTEEWPTLCTFFEAEIVGDRYSFLTKKWDADADVDRMHWTKFPAFEPYQECFASENFQCDNTNANVLFMRWKEHFLVPDHRIETITGASFAGFYYIAYDRTAGTLVGYYYHKSSEKFQRLSLRHQSERHFGVYEFR
ncbi:vacuolar import and degradation protein-domain-containing protein [Polychytrium aggregatum]|uniref:vacuolar import and degradation protein-domain-containing protein n=1 Tax=Polychytrium aggregatum TaxID=110093 RepID=UPI0022FEDD50|nr:vacuolar import and degradation protein-domain-containing protein [Polychytrium aggregatum]KAI9203812.1 vacuolar import and degradation protein-domain-containing protein [Polychytrium aggregatum]